MRITGYHHNILYNAPYTTIEPITSQKTVIRRALKYYLKSDLILSRKVVETIQDILKESKIEIGRP